MCSCAFIICGQFTRIAFTESWGRQVCLQLKALIKYSDFDLMIFLTLTIAQEGFGEL